jgi:flagellar assembly factor FliW
MKLVQLITVSLNETYSKVHIDKHFSHTFPFINGLKHGDALSPLPFGFALEYDIRMVQENQVELKLNATHQLLAYTDVNLLEDNTVTINKNTETLIGTSKKVGLDANIEKMIYTLASFHENAGQNRDIKTASRSFENVSQFIYLVSDSGRN